MNKINKTKNEYWLDHIRSVAITTIITAAILGVGTVSQGFIALQAFAAEGKRYTMEDAEKNSDKVYKVLNTLQRDSRQNREAIIRIEAISSRQIQILEEMAQHDM